MAAQIAKTLKDKDVQCRNSIFKKQTECKFFDFLPLNVLDNMCLYYSTRTTMHLFSFAQNADPLMKLGGSSSSLSEEAHSTSQKRD